MTMASGWTKVAVTVGAVVFVALGLPRVGQAQTGPQTAPQMGAQTRGEKLVQEKCARCHATGRTDASPEPKAPPFRNVGKLYPPEHLAEALAEGIVTGDNDMPQFKFDPKDIDAIIDYLAEISAAR